MPELPEVETIARGLVPLICGSSIQNVDLVQPGCVQGDVQAFVQGLTGAGIDNVRRRGKLLIMDLSSGLLLVGHFKMTGKFLFYPPGHSVQTSHTRCILHLDSDCTLVFEDQRKFGYLRLMTQEEMETWPFYAHLGPEPLDISAHDFGHRLRTRHAAIKSLLLNQTCIAGIGNIYADESLYLAGIHPQTPADTLSSERLKKLHASLQQVLTTALQAGGSSFRDYVDGLGRPGSYQDTFMVYGRGGKTCPHCQTDLETARVAGRTSVFCPCCQPKP